MASTGEGRGHRPGATAGEHIAVGVDGSLTSRAAVRWALAHAEPGDTVTLVHAWKPGHASYVGDPVDVPEQEAARRFVEQEQAHAACLRRPPDVTLTSVAVEGDAARVLLDADCDLLVLGARGWGLTDRLLGSVCSAVTRHCRRPVVVVPHEQP